MTTENRVTCQLCYGQNGEHQAGCAMPEALPSKQCLHGMHPPTEECVWCENERLRGRVDYLERQNRILLEDPRISAMWERHQRQLDAKVAEITAGETAPQAPIAHVTVREY